MKIEKLDKKDREYLADCNHRDRGPKALRIIDALTEALAAAEQRTRAELGHCPRCVDQPATPDRTELLRRCQQAVSPVSLLGRDLDAFLSAQPATPDRTKAPAVTLDRRKERLLRESPDPAIRAMAHRPAAPARAEPDAFVFPGSPRECNKKDADD